MHSNDKQRQLKLYFAGLEIKLSGLFFVVSLFLYLCLMAAGATGFNNVLLIVVLASAGVTSYQVYRYFSAPSDEIVDTWLKEAVQAIVDESYQKLGISREGEERAPLVIVSPVYWSVRGVEVNELGLRKGKDNVLRFSMYQFTVFHLHPHLLGAYITHYNFVSNTLRNEMTREYHYRDIVSVATEPIIANYRMPDGERRLEVQEFRLSVASGENIKLVVTPETIARQKNGQLSPTGAEQAVSVIRNILRTKKGA